MVVEDHGHDSVRCSWRSPRALPVPRAVSAAPKVKPTAMNYAERITFAPEQCGGRPCIRHYRLRVKDVPDMLAGGATQEQILRDYAFLEPDDIRACLEFAADHVNYPVVAAA